jgi:DGQHR domain-containing protein
MSEIIWKRYPCITVTQPIGTFYVASISARDLRDMCWADIRRIERGERNVEVISGIQRPLSQKRQKEIAKYVNTVDASFPTGIIVAIGPDDAIYDQETHSISIRLASHVATLIDGQHRIEGLRGYSDGVFELNTTIFIDIETQDQAILFSVINVTHAHLFWIFLNMQRPEAPRKLAMKLQELLIRAATPHSKNESKF